MYNINIWRACSCCPQQNRVPTAVKTGFPQQLKDQYSRQSRLLGIKNYIIFPDTTLKSILFFQTFFRVQPNFLIMKFQFPQDKNFQIFLIWFRMKDFRHLFEKKCSPWLKKILNLEVLIWSRINNFIHLFEKKSSPWLKKILNLEVLIRSRMKDFDILLKRNLHHG